jgi:hypothetical protein
VWWSNDGMGRMQERTGAGISGLLGATLRAVGVGTSDDPTPGVAFLLADGRIGFWGNDGAPTYQLSPGSLWSDPGTVRGGSRLEAADVDQDGLLDLVVLLLVEEGSGATRSFLALLPGREPDATDPMPWVLPSGGAQLVELDEGASDLAIGDFAPDAVGERALEVAVASESGAMPGIYFFRVLLEGVPYFASTDGGEPKIGGNLAPSELLASDVDADGRADLLVVSSNRNTLLVLRQSRPRDPQVPLGDPDPAAFEVSAEEVLPVGLAERALLSDVDGDGIRDVVVQIRDRQLATRERVVVLIQNGAGGIAGTQEVPGSQLGEGAGNLSFDVGDLNGDAIPDLLLGWTGLLGMGNSHVRELFGSWR